MNERREWLRLQGRMQAIAEATGLLRQMQIKESRRKKWSTKDSEV